MSAISGFPPYIERKPTLLPPDWKSLPLFTSLIPSIQTDGMVIDLNGKMWLATQPWEVKNKNVRIQNGQIVALVGNGASTTIQVNGGADKFVADRLDFIASASNSSCPTGKNGKVGFRIYGNDANVDGCTFTDFTDGIFVGASAVKTELMNVQSFRLSGELLYVAGAKFGKAVNLICDDGSTKEHPIRIDTAEGTNANSAGAWLIINSRLFNNNGKECIAIRMAGGTNELPVVSSQLPVPTSQTGNSQLATGNYLGTLINGGSLANPQLAGIRIGQEPNNHTTVPISAPNVTLNAVHFNGCYVLIDQGAFNFTANACTFDWLPHKVPFQFGGPCCNGTLIATIVNLHAQKYDNRLYVASNMGQGDTVTATGTVVNI